MASDVTLWSLIRGDFWGSIVALGGIPTVVGGLAGWIGGWLKDRHLASYKADLDRDAATYRADLDTRAEAHKAALKRQELIFNKRVEAASELSEALHAFDDSSLPEDDNMQRLRVAISRMKDTISSFRGKYSPVFPESIRNQMKLNQEIATSLAGFLEQEDPEQHAIDIANASSALSHELNALEAAILTLVAE